MQQQAFNAIPHHHMQYLCAVNYDSVTFDIELAFWRCKLQWKTESDEELIQFPMTDCRYR